MRREERVMGGGGGGGTGTDRKSIGPLSKSLQRSSMLGKISHSDVKGVVHPKMKCTHYLLGARACVQCVRANVNVSPEEDIRGHLG